MTRIKICGLRRQEDAAYVNRSLPDYAGFILNYPKSRRNIDLQTGTVLRRILNPGIQAVGVTVDLSIEEVATAATLVGLDIVQLHGHEDDRYIESLRKVIKKPVWKTFLIKELSDLDAVENCVADMVLLDTGYGCGEKFDWKIARKFSRPFILAGGLNSENVRDAIKVVHPWCVDVSSGVETFEVKDESKIKSFIRAVRETEM